jgi:hypothetical protein
MMDTVRAGASDGWQRGLRQLEQAAALDGGCNPLINFARAGMRTAMAPDRTRRGSG